MTKKFNIHEVAVREIVGDTYCLSNYTEGTDYIKRKCFKSYRNMFREDILGATSVDPSLVEHKQEPIVQEQEPIVAKVVKKYPNTTIVDTSVGRIFVGKYGPRIKVGQDIVVKNGHLHTKMKKSPFIRFTTIDLEH